jgi:hypothetical protein
MILMNIFELELWAAATGSQQTLTLHGRRYETCALCAHFADHESGGHIHTTFNSLVRVGMSLFSLLSL